MGLWVLMHDNDPKHTARLTCDFLAEEQIEVLEWPVSSPNINPIKKLWRSINFTLENIHQKILRN